MISPRKRSTKLTDTNELLQTPSQIGAHLQGARETAGFDQEEVARRIGIHPQTLSKYERGATRKIPSRVVSSLAALYGVSSDDLLSGNAVELSQTVSRGTSRQARWSARRLFGSNLHVLRRRDAMSQTGVAQAVGVRPATVSDWERGEVEPEPANVAKIAELFRIPVSELTTQDLSTRRWTWADHKPPADVDEASRRVRGIQLRLEGDLVAWGASDADREAARAALAVDETVQLLARCETQKDLEETFDVYVRFVEALRLAFGERVMRRSVPSIRELGPLTPVPRSTPSSGARRVGEDPTT